jgi:glyoxylate/hydroxypyruvate reductase A
MSLVLIRKTAPVEAWLAALARQCPDVPVYVWPETGPVDEVEFVLTWAADPGVIASFPNLRAVFSLGAGVDHILNDATVPTALPVARMIDPSLTHAMVQFVTLAVLSHQRSHRALLAQQAESRWARLPAVGARVGVMGLGELGSACASALAGLGLDCAGWSRSEKTLTGVANFSGEAGLAPFLARTDILICLLPRTDALDGVLGADTFAQLPRGAYLINVGRGEHLDEDALIDVLASGQLSGAWLDVFRQEPLPATHRFWTHPAITVTPHIASYTVPATAVAHVAENIRRARMGEPLAGLVRRELGY